ncbi:histidine kinase N-terminal 7TM domain-containing diguanylate cyclase [Paenibacillus sp. FA6]|uniref:histidine kinase N-terminal 7TM domain-containing diguanylate cyclase n=1 Tax=Paenibacillus sp. FA6 TaxID=3413029 RepID=UPI003F65F5E5
MLFLVLFILFVYVFFSVTITKLHKVYLVLHFAMMLWPLCQFAIKTTENPQFQLFYVKLAFVDAVLIITGWFLFTISLTDQLHLLRKRVSLVLLVSALFITLGVIVNPNGLFVLPMYGGYIQRSYGPIFWFMITVMITYVIISLYIIYLALVSNNTPRIKKQVAHVLKGVVVLTAFILLDVFLNVTLALSPVIPGMTSLGISLSAIFFVIAIHRDKVFDLVTIAHQDIINTIGHGIVVLDDNQHVVEVNQPLLPYVNFIHIGDHFNIEMILPREQSTSQFDVFLHTYREQPLERAEIEAFYPQFNIYTKIHAAPILVNDVMVGRIVTFQDMTELHQLIDEAHLQNEILQERNLALIRIQNELFQTNRKLKQMALTDSLTGCYNRHYLTQQLEQEVMKNMKYQSPFAIFLLDIDLFKSINDNYGHLVGDIVLCKTVDIIKKTLRQADILARYGGEEFIVYLPNTNQLQANILAERVKSTIEMNKVAIDDGAYFVSITISMGLLSINNSTNLNTNNPKINLNDLFESVDKALYQAKEEGRNRIVSVAI